MANVATLTAKMAFDVSNFQRGVGVVTSGIQRIEQGGLGTLAGVFSAGAVAGLGFAAAMKVVHSSINLVAAATDKAIDAMAFGVKLAAEAELAEVGFGVMIGSAKRAKQLMKDLEAFAIKTPFGMTGVQEATKTLLGAGFADSQIIPTLKTLGDLSGGSAEKLSHLAIVFGQIQARGKLTADNFRQITEAGINMRQALADEVGVSVANLDKAMEQGKISFAAFRNALIEVSETRFGGRLDAEANTAIGAFNRIGEVSSGILKDIAKGVGEAFGTNGLLNDMAGFLEYVRTELVPGITKSFVFMGRVIINVFDNVFRLLGTQLEQAGTALAMLAGTGGLGGFTIPAGKAGFALAGLGKNLQKSSMSNEFGALLKELGNLAPKGKPVEGLKKTFNFFGELDKLTSGKLAMGRNLGRSILTPFADAFGGASSALSRAFTMRGGETKSGFSPTGAIQVGSAEAMSAIVRNIMGGEKRKEELTVLKSIAGATSKTAESIEAALRNATAGVISVFGG
jgi:tape measure domain-containing protein